MGMTRRGSFFVSNEQSMCYCSLSSETLAVSLRKKVIQA